jgi:uncharacterized protein (TIGR03000 family)
LEEYTGQGSAAHKEVIMRRAWFVVAVCLLLPALSSAQEKEIILPDGSPLSGNGGLIIMRRGDQTIVSFGGAFLNRRVKVKTATPEGPVVTHFTLPAIARSLTPPPFPPPPTSPATILVNLPDPYGLVYIDGQLVRTKTPDRVFESSPLPVGVEYPVRFKAVFQVGEKILVEEKTVTLRASDHLAVTFDGTTAISVPAPQAAVK